MLRATVGRSKTSHRCRSNRSRTWVRWGFVHLVQRIPARLPRLGVRFRKEEIDSALTIGVDRVRDAAVEGSVDLGSSALASVCRVENPGNSKLSRISSWMAKLMMSARSSILSAASRMAVERTTCLISSKVLTRRCWRMIFTCRRRVPESSYSAASETMSIPRS